jgi:hypothetical protein
MPDSESIVAYREVGQNSGYFRVCGFAGVYHRAPYNLGMLATNNPYREPLVRPLTPYERDLIRWLIEHSRLKEANRLLPQIDRLSVVSRCNCGCPTIDLALDGKACSAKRPRMHR